MAKQSTGNRNPVAGEDRSIISPDLGSPVPASQDPGSPPEKAPGLPQVEEIEEILTPESLKREREREKDRKKYQKRKDLQVGAENAAVILSILDGLAMSVIGPDGVMNEIEKTLIQEPLERIMGRLDWEVGETIGKWSDPILLVFGLVAWGSRLMDIAREKKALSDSQRYINGASPSVTTGPVSGSDGSQAEGETTGHNNNWQAPIEIAMRGTPVSVDEKKVGRAKNAK